MCQADILNLHKEFTNSIVMRQAINIKRSQSKGHNSRDVILVFIMLDKCIRPLPFANLF